MIWYLLVYCCLFMSGFLFVCSLFYLAFIVVVLDGVWLCGWYWLLAVTVLV